MRGKRSEGPSFIGSGTSKMLFFHRNRLHEPFRAHRYAGVRRARAGRGGRRAEGSSFPDGNWLASKTSPTSRRTKSCIRCSWRKRAIFPTSSSLDANMVFRRDTALQEILDVFGRIPGLDCLMLDVQDWYSNALMPRNTGVLEPRALAGQYRCPDGRSCSALPGADASIERAPAPVVNHSPNPSALQAFRFGVHRALKAT